MAEADDSALVIAIAKLGATSYELRNKMSTGAYKDLRIFAPQRYKAVTALFGIRVVACDVDAFYIGFDMRFSNVEKLL